ncbi:MAG: autotransporter outer membrane beta-barrel domain-containing protein [Thermodesulforhabdaceae bacterium]
MKKLWCITFGAVFLLFAGVSLAATVEDITKETIVGPGSVAVATKGDLLMSFGAQARFVPTFESNWDFGMSDNVSGFLGGALNRRFFEQHANEAGTVIDQYIRSENRLYFNAMSKDRAWSFYAALEYDKPIDTNAVDNRGGFFDSSNFGLERLNASVALPFDMRLHAGWDVWGVDHYEGGGLVYADDNPGFWLDGSWNGDQVIWSVAYHKLQNSDWQPSIKFVGPNTASKAFYDLDDDRDVLAGWAKIKLTDDHSVKLFYTFDRIRNMPVRDFLSAMSGGAAGITGNSYPEVDSHHIGGYWTGKFGIINVMLEGVYQFGSADNTGLSRYGRPEDYDISAYAFAGDISVDLKEFFGFSVKPHVGFIYTSGDDDPTDDELSGYEGVANAQRFATAFGGENTILADTNYVLGTALYGFIPEFYGNGTPVPTGGLVNFSGTGNGRGDNPGMTMLSFGVTIMPEKFLIYRTNANIFWWNEDFYVTSWVNPAITSRVDSGYVGTEWDNEITLALNKHVFVKAQWALFFPGDVIKDVTRAISGTKADDMASRVAAELIWNF